MKRLLYVVPLALFLWLGTTRAGFAQTPTFAEGFDAVGTTDPTQDGPAALLARGWQFRNQSQPEGSSDWYGSDGGQVMVPHAGTGFLAADINNTDPIVPGAAISNWAIVPAVAGQASGTAMTFAVGGSYTGRNDRLQVRYAPSGGTDTGTDAEDVGDFTQLLLDINPVSQSGWEEFTLSLPGPGRIAFRYYLPAPLGAGTMWGNYFGIDSLVIGTPPPGEVPVPQPGQSVTWGIEHSPIEITGRLIIPAGGTVLVEPGVEIYLNAESTLEVRGTVQGVGTESQPIRMTAATNFPPAVHVVGGNVHFTHAIVNGNMKPDDGATMTFDQTRFEGNGLFFADNYLAGRVPYLQITNSHFEGPNAHINIAHLTLVLKNTTFHQASANILYAHAYLDQVTFDGGRLSLSTDDQPDYINNVTIRNATTPGMTLGGGNQGNDFFLGPNTTLHNNQYPVQVTSGGLLPGSTVPATGNQTNMILGPGDGDFRGPVTWADVGIPYRIDGYAYLFGKWRLLPGSTFKIVPGGGLESRVAVQARGVPGNPVTFEPLVAGQRWNRLVEFQRLEYAIVDGGDYGLVFDSSGDPNFVDSTILRNNGFAVVGASYIRSSQFANNGVGLRDGNFPLYIPPDANGATNPNSFTGNGMAAQIAEDAAFNWWNSPTGPTTPENPTGTGDPVAPGVPFQPFRTTPPDFSDTPPVVTLYPVSDLLEPGSTVMLMWSGQDDGTIDHYRILFAAAGDHPLSYTVVADQVPATQNAYQWTVPDIGFQVTGQPASIRIEAMDDRGQIGWVAQEVGIISERIEATLTMNPNPGGNSYQAGYDAFDVCWSLSGTNEYVSGVEGYLFLDADRRFIPLGGVTTYLNCLPLTLRMPLLHSEDVRLALKVHGGLNDEKWFFSEPFTVFADPRVGDTPPEVTLTSPQAGQVFPAGGIVPVVWQASDDEALRSFDIQASYDGGRTWHVVAEQLPASTRSYEWRTAPNSHLQDVRVRVIARDLRFQNTSDGATRVFAIGTEAGPTPTATPMGTHTSTPTPVPSFTPTVGPTTTPGPTITPTATGTVPPPGVTPSATGTSVPPTATPMPPQPGYRLYLPAIRRP